MIIYTTTHEGQTATRKSAGHGKQEYHFAIWVKGDASGWTCEAYTSRMDLAHARANEFRRFYTDVAIAPVSAEAKAVKARPTVDFPGETFTMCDVNFSGGNDTYARFGTYRGWSIRLTCSGRIFRAAALLNDNDWQNRLYVPNGGLESRVKAIKAAIDEKFASK